VVVVAILAFTLFGGAVLTLNLRQGLAAMTKRFGADLMVVPEGAAGKAQSLLLQGGANFFYFDEAIAGRVAQTEGVACASPQFFLTSLSTECCDAAVQLIAYDPATDFVVQPWIAERYRGQVEDGQVVVGSHINLDSDGAIKLFNNQYPVAAQLSRSASGLDTSVFMTMNTMQQLIDRGQAEGYNFLAVQKDGIDTGLISAVLVKTDPSKNPSGLAYTIRRENEGVEVLVSSRIFAGIAETLSGLTDYVYLFAALVWLLGFIR
jgi:putative ABC transport system permease protein